MSNIASWSLATAETPRPDSRPRVVSEENLSSLHSVSPWPAEGRFSQAFLQDMRHALGAQSNIQESNWALGLYWATALWLVNKANATTPFGLKDFVNWAANNQGYSEQDFKKCEVIILHALKWQINPPVPSDMIVPVVHGMPTLLEAEKQSVCELTLQQLAARSSLEDLEFHQCNPKELVVCAILNSMEILNKKTKDYYELQKEFSEFKLAVPFLDHVKERLKRAIRAMY